MATIIQRIRCPVDCVNRLNRFIDIMPLSNNTPNAWRASKMQLELGFFWGFGVKAVMLPAFDDVAAISVGIKDNANKNGPYVAGPKTVLNADITKDLTIAQWNAGMLAHIIVPFSDTEMDLTPGQYWLEVDGVDNDGKKQFFGATVLTILETGVGGPPAVVTPVPYRVDGSFQMKWPDGQYYAINPVLDADGKPTLSVGDTPISAVVPSGDPQPFRVAGALLMKWPNGQWCSIAPVLGDDGKPTLSIVENPS